MKPKCNNCRGLYQEKNEILDKGGVCAICKPEVDYREQIALTDKREEEDIIEYYYKGKINAIR